jgi:hypothetical protein
MNCDDVELALLEGPPSEELKAHLTGCPRCQAFSKDVSLIVDAARLPEPDAQERAAMASLPETTWSAWRQARRPSARSWVGYAAAASFGAMVASAGFWVTRPVREVIVEKTVERPAALAADLDPNFSGDDVFFEVTWPELPEGETP